MTKTRLFTPGPTPLPDRIRTVLGQPIIHHRTPEFREAVKEVTESLQYLYDTKQPVLSLSSSGTGSMEAAISNLFSPGDHVITVNGGKFGERWGRIARAFQLDVSEIMLEWGQSVLIEQIEERMTPQTRGVFLTHSETSSGALTDICGIASALRSNYDGLIVVDGITAIGAHELHFDDWDLDVVVTGSQKGLMIPPGLASIALSERAWRATETARLPRFYFDLKAARDTLAKGDTPWTPAIPLLLALREAMKMIREEGREAVWERHSLLAAALRAAGRALNLRLLARSPSNALTAFHIPGKADEVRSFLKDQCGFTVAGGQGAYKGDLIRVSHLGWYDAADMVAIVHAIESALSSIGHEGFEVGAGLVAAQRILLDVRG